MTRGATRLHLTPEMMVMLQADVDLSQIMRWANFIPQHQSNKTASVKRPPAASAASSSANGPVSLTAAASAQGTQVKYSICSQETLVKLLRSFRQAAEGCFVRGLALILPFLHQAWGSSAQRLSGISANGSRRPFNSSANGVAEASMARSATAGPLAAYKDAEAALATVVREQADEPRQAAVTEAANGAPRSNGTSAAGAAWRNGNGAAAHGAQGLQAAGSDLAASGGAEPSPTAEMQAKRTFTQRREVRWNQPDPRFDQASQILAPLRYKPLEHFSKATSVLTASMTRTPTYCLVYSHACLY